MQTLSEVNPMDRTRIYGNECLFAHNNFLGNRIEVGKLELNPMRIGGGRGDFLQRVMNLMRDPYDEMEDEAAFEDDNVNYDDEDEIEEEEEAIRDYLTLNGTKIQIPITMFSTSEQIINDLYHGNWDSAGLSTQMNSKPQVVVTYGRKNRRGPAPDPNAILFNVSRFSAKDSIDLKLEVPFLPVNSPQPNMPRRNSSPHIRILSEQPNPPLQFSTLVSPTDPLDNPFAISSQRRSSPPRKPAASKPKQRYERTSPTKNTGISKREKTSIPTLKKTVTAPEIFSSTIEFTELSKSSGKKTTTKKASPPNFGGDSHLPDTTRPKIIDTTKVKFKTKPKATTAIEVVPKSPERSTRSRDLISEADDYQYTESSPPKRSNKLRSKPTFVDPTTLNVTDHNESLSMDTDNHDPYDFAIPAADEKVPVKPKLKKSATTTKQSIPKPDPPSKSTIPAPEKKTVNINNSANSPETSSQPTGPVKDQLKNQVTPLRVNKKSVSDSSAMVSMFTPIRMLEETHISTPLQPPMKQTSSIIDIDQLLGSSPPNSPRGSPDSEMFPSIDFSNANKSPPRQNLVNRMKTIEKIPQPKLRRSGSFSEFTFTKSLLDVEKPESKSTLLFSKFQPAVQDSSLSVSSTSIFQSSEFAIGGLDKNNAMGIGSIRQTKSVGITYGKTRSVLETPVHESKKGDKLDDLDLILGPSRPDDVFIESDCEDDVNRKEAKSIYELREAGEMKRLKDEMDYILDGFGGHQPVSVKRSSCIDLSKKILSSQFLIKIRAHDFISRVFNALREENDSILLSATSFIFAIFSKDSRVLDLLITSESNYSDALFVMLRGMVDLTPDPLSKEPKSKYEKNLVIEIKSVIQQSQYSNCISTSSLAIQTLCNIINHLIPKEPIDDQAAFQMQQVLIKEKINSSGMFQSVLTKLFKWTNAKKLPLVDRCKQLENYLQVVEFVVTSFDGESEAVSVFWKNDGKLMVELFNIVANLNVYKTEIDGDKVHKCLIIALRLLVMATSNPTETRCSSEPSTSFCIHHLTKNPEVKPLNILLRLLMYPNTESNRMDIDGEENRCHSDQIDVKMMAVGLMINVVESCELNLQDLYSQVVGLQCAGNESCLNLCNCQDGMGSIEVLVKSYKPLVVNSEEDAFDNKLLAAYIAVLIGLLMRLNTQTQNLVLSLFNSPSTNEKKATKNKKLKPKDNQTITSTSNSASGSISSMISLLQEFASFQKMLIAIENGEVAPEDLQYYTTTKNQTSSSSSGGSSSNVFTTPVSKRSGWNSAVSRSGGSPFSMDKEERARQLSLVKKMAVEEMGAAGKGAAGEAAVAMAMASIERQFETMESNASPTKSKNVKKEEKRIKCVLDIVEMLEGCLKE
ncbi:hypothetical protein HK098_004352 [Nowakowskiella sp. JEL0407]|nr:hypothetical protein HK098_004352 [Nowakowskiella sp. JEL0407]